MTRKVLIDADLIQSVLEDWDLQIHSENFDKLQAALDAPEPEPVKVIADSINEAWRLGQLYWQQADSDFISQQNKSDATREKFIAMRDSALAALKHDPRQMREMLRAMQAGEMTISRGIELIEIWLTGNYADDLLPPIRNIGLNWDDIPADVIVQLRKDRVALAAPQPEPVAWRIRGHKDIFTDNPKEVAMNPEGWEPLYLAPPEPADVAALREWLGECREVVKQRLFRLNQQLNGNPLSRSAKLEEEWLRGLLKKIDAIREK